LAAASFSALGGTAQLATSEVQQQAAAAAHSGAAALASDNVAELATNAAFVGRGVVGAYANLAIASAAACFTSQGEWALREGYITTPHNNQAPWVAGGLFAAAATQHAKVFPAYFPVASGRIVASAPVRLISRRRRLG
jgi:hypothetical protein